MGEIRGVELVRKAMSANPFHAERRRAPSSSAVLAESAMSYPIPHQGKEECAAFLLDEIRKVGPPTGRITKPREEFRKRAKEILTKSAKLRKERYRKRYDALTTSVGGELACFFVNEDHRGPIAEIDQKLTAVLSQLGQNLAKEFRIYVKERFTAPYLNLSKVSVAQVLEKLRVLENHKEELVRRQARTILYAALQRGNLNLADKLAERAVRKYKELQATADQTILALLDRIMEITIRRGRLGYADELIEELKASERIIERHPNPIVRIGKMKILNDFVTQGSLEEAIRKYIIRARSRTEGHSPNSDRV